MSAPARRAEFFALEANEYLSELDQLAAVAERPDAERLVRGARALRGAALMAGLGTYARAAAGLEALARQVRDHALNWSPHPREAWRGGLSTLRALVARAPQWSAAEDRQALALSERLDQVLHGRPVAPAESAPTALTPGVRAFIARESALIAGSLEIASRALDPVPPTAALSAVLERLRALRGLGGAAELSPLPELLDAMEIATRTLLSETPPPPGVARVFAEAAHALSAMARAVAEDGRIVEPPELDGIARQLLDSYADPRDVVEIEALAPAHELSIAVRGKAPGEGAGSDPIPVELVSVGDHFLAVAEAMTRPMSNAARELRLFALHRTLAVMPAATGTGRFLAPLTRALAQAIVQRKSTTGADALVAMLRGCGRFLVDAAGTGDRHALLNRRDAIAASLNLMVGSPDRSSTAGQGSIGTVSLPAPAGGPLLPVVDIASLAPDEGAVAIDPLPVGSSAPIEVLGEAEVVDIAALAPDSAPIALTLDDAADGVVSIESLAPDPVPIIPAIAPGQPTRLERALARRRELEREGGERASSIDGLIGAEIVPITALLYRGASALHRAAELRSQLSALLDRPGVSVEQLRPLLRELLDLVPLVRDAA